MKNIIDFIIYLIHMVFALFIILLPFYPVNILKYIFYIPIIIIILQIRYNGCPLSKFHKEYFNFSKLQSIILEKIIFKHDKKRYNKNKQFYNIGSIIIGLILIFSLSVIKLYNYYYNI